MKKRLLFSFFSIVLCLPAWCQLRGDLNNDNQVDVTDVSIMIDMVLGKAQQDLTIADLDGNGHIDVTDVSFLIDIVLGKDNGSSQDQGDWVDLGLPSGTLWATRNIGADSPEDYGDFFAWGETSPKANYTNIDGEICYKWFDIWYDEKDHSWYGGFTKYCIDSSHGFKGFVDNKTELDLADDAAAANWGGGARMPSLDQIKELVNSCSWGLTFLNGVAGQIATGPNGNSIFFPASGYYVGVKHWCGGLNGTYLSRMMSGAGVDGDGIYSLYFNPGDPILHEGCRFYGFTVRAVRVP